STSLCVHYTRLCNTSIREGSCCAPTHDANVGKGSTRALLPKAKLILSLDKDTYEETGLQVVHLRIPVQTNHSDVILFQLAYSRTSAQTSPEHRDGPAVPGAVEQCPQGTGGGSGVSSAPAESGSLFISTDLNNEPNNFLSTSKHISSVGQARCRFKDLWVALSPGEKMNMVFRTKEIIYTTLRFLTVRTTDFRWLLAS
ncbi:Ribonuclease P protein subunit p40, partial [Galemys pyrenaicus]